MNRNLAPTYTYQPANQPYTYQPGYDLQYLDQPPVSLQNQNQLENQQNSSPSQTQKDSDCCCSCCNCGCCDGIKCDPECVKVCECCLVICEMFALCLACCF